MRDAAALLVSIALPWMAGALAFSALARHGGRSLPWVIGHGYLPGVVVATLGMRALDLADVRWSVVSVSLPIVACALACGWLSRAAWRGRWGRAPLLVAPTAQSAAARAVFWACFVLLVVRITGLSLEVLWRPLLPWDAWSQWATKARVWFEFGRLVPFVAPGAWLSASDAMRFVDMHSYYPGTVPLFQVWTGLWLGRWDESLMNAPWIATVVAFGFAFYAQLRRAGAAPEKAMLFAYLLLSIPFFNLHVAIAGVADLFVATAYGMAAMSTWHWCRSRLPADLVVAVVMAGICALVKLEGLFWAATLAPAMLVAVHRRAGLWLLGLAAGTAIAYLAVGPQEVWILGYAVRTKFINVSLPLLQHLFVMDNWHLLWYAAVIVVVLRARRLFAPEFAPLTATIAGALAFVGVVFFFSSAAGGVDDETLVNRLPFHMVPALMYYLALLLLDAPSRRAVVPSAAQSTAAA